MKKHGMDHLEDILRALNVIKQLDLQKIDNKNN